MTSNILLSLFILVPLYVSYVNDKKELDTKEESANWFFIFYSMPDKEDISENKSTIFMWLLVLIFISIPISILYFGIRILENH